MTITIKDHVSPAPSSSLTSSSRGTLVSGPALGQVSCVVPEASGTVVFLSNRRLPLPTAVTSGGGAATVVAVAWFILLCCIWHRRGPCGRRRQVVYLPELQPTGVLVMMMKIVIYMRTYKTHQSCATFVTRDNAYMRVFVHISIILTFTRCLYCRVFF